MKTCPICQKTYSDEIESCPRDGARLVAESRDERECPSCAEQILKKARVCKHCGREVEPLTGTGIAVKTPSPAPPQALKKYIFLLVGLALGVCWSAWRGRGIDEWGHYETFSEGLENPWVWILAGFPFALVGFAIGAILDKLETRKTIPTMPRATPSAPPQIFAEPPSAQASSSYSRKGWLMMTGGIALALLGLVGGLVGGDYVRSWLFFPLRMFHCYGILRKLHDPTFWTVLNLGLLAIGVVVWYAGRKQAARRKLPSQDSPGIQDK